MNKEYIKIVEENYKKAILKIKSGTKNGLEEGRLFLNKCLEFENKFLDVNNQHIYNFTNPVDFVIFVDKNKNKGYNIEWCRVPFYQIYMGLVYIDIEEKNWDSAHKNIENALLWSPGNIEALFQINEIYKMNGQFDKLKDNTDKIFDNIYDAVNLARYYRTLGYYNIEMKNYELAYALYCISLMFARDEGVFVELDYICKVQGIKPYKLEPKEAVKIVKDAGIQFGIRNENEEQMLRLLKGESLKMDDAVKQIILNQLYSVTLPVAAIEQK